MSSIDRAALAAFAATFLVLTIPFALAMIGD